MTVYKAFTKIDTIQLKQVQTQHAKRDSFLPVLFALAFSFMKGAYKMTIDNVFKWLDRNGYREKEYIKCGNSNYFDNHNYTCFAIRVYTDNYTHIKQYLNRYKKHLFYKIGYSYAMNEWYFTIFNLADHERLKEYLYYKNQSVDECAKYMHENRNDHISNDVLKSIMAKHEKRYMNSVKHGIYKNLTA